MIHFDPQPSGRIVAKLGIIAVGEVAPNTYGVRQKAWVRVFLPDAPGRPLPASTMEAGKRILEAKVRDWLEAAGLVVAARVARRSGQDDYQSGWMP